MANHSYPVKCITQDQAHRTAVHHKRCYWATTPLKWKNTKKKYAHAPLRTRNRWKDRISRQNELAVILCMQQNTASDFCRASDFVEVAEWLVPLTKVPKVVGSNPLLSKQIFLHSLDESLSRQATTTKKLGWKACHSYPVKYYYIN